MFTIALQRRRLRSTEPEDATFTFRWRADLQFFVVALTRLRSAAKAFRKARWVKIDEAITRFDEALPSLLLMRDVAEHIDEYAVDSSKRLRKHVQRFELAVFQWNGSTFKWLGTDFDIGAASEAAKELFNSMMEEKRRFMARQ